MSRTCLTEVFSDVHPLSVGEPPDYRCPGCRGNRGVDGVDVVAQVDRLLRSVQTGKLTFILLNRKRQTVQVCS